MVDRTEEIRATAAQCLALAHSTTDPLTRTALITMSQRLYELTSNRAAEFEAAQREFNDRQMLPPTEPQPAMQQQQQMQPKKED